MKTFYAKRKIVHFNYPYASSVFKSKDGQKRYVIGHEASTPVTYDTLCVAILDDTTPKIGDTVCVISGKEIYIDKVKAYVARKFILEHGSVEFIFNCHKVIGTNKVEGVSLPLIDYKTLYEYLIIKKNIEYVYVSILSKFNLPSCILKILDKFNIFSKYFQAQTFYVNNLFLDIKIKK